MRRAAWIYAALTFVVCVFHIGMILGAPWGHLTMGGRWDGVMPLEGRVASATSMVLLTCLALVVLARAGLVLDGTYGDSRRKPHIGSNDFVRGAFVTQCK